MNTWMMDESGEMTATGTAIPVMTDGQMFAQVSPLWSDGDGVRVSIDWMDDPNAGFARVEDMSQRQALVLAEVLAVAAGLTPPEACGLE